MILFDLLNIDDISSPKSSRVPVMSSLWRAYPWRSPNEKHNRRGTSTVRYNECDGDRWYDTAFLGHFMVYSTVFPMDSDVWNVGQSKHPSGSVSSSLPFLGPRWIAVACRIRVPFAFLPEISEAAATFTRTSWDSRQDYQQRTFSVTVPLQ